MQPATHSPFINYELDNQQEESGWWAERDLLEHVINCNWWAHEHNVRIMDDILLGWKTAWIKIQQASITLLLLDERSVIYLVTYSITQRVPRMDIRWPGREQLSSNEMNEKVTWIMEDERRRCEDESQSRWLAERNEKWRAGYGVHGHGELASILFFAPDIMAPAVAISSFGPAILILVISFFNFPIQKF